MTTTLPTTARLEPTGHPDDKWGWAAQLALSIKNIPTGAGDVINVQAVYTDGATRYNFQNLAAVAGSYTMYGGTSLAGAYQSVGSAIAPDSVFVTAGRRNRSRPGASVALTPTTGIPTGTPAIYGAYAQAQFGTAG